jgi:tetratricopeptide (TPR) repeat protein
VAAIYNSLGQTREAMAFFNRVQERYAAMRTAAPAAIDIQAASLLVNSDNNSDNDAGLYHQLLLLGDRRDLSDEQRRTIQMIWTNWAIRRASQCADAGETGSSLVLLNAAAHSFPDNPAVPRALADGYVRAGLPQQAVLIFKSQNMTAATASDYKSAVDAAAAAGDTKDAKIWLHSGLDKFPKDPEMLNLGAKYEQAHGNSKRAAEYSRAARAALAALAALPPQDPGAELAIELSKPQPIARPSTPKQPQDLAPLLGGLDAQEVAPQSKPAPLYLPSYSNIYGAAPVQVPLQPSNDSVVPSSTTNTPH